jgi:AcrR family transcriptional regulator
LADIEAQRPRLLEAMVESIGWKGYRAATVADVVALAGVSRKTFYEHFANKRECSLAAYDLVSEQVAVLLAGAHSEAEGRPARIETAIRALFEGAIENPGVARLMALEILAVGAGGIQRREASIAHCEEFLRDALGSGRGATAQTVLKALTGGLIRVLHGRVLRAERSVALDLVPDLVTWASVYFPIPGPIAAASSHAEHGRASALEGGRAPGTLAPRPRVPGRRGLARGDQHSSRSFVVHDQRERILDAVANLTAREGYGELKVERIAEQAAVSLSALYEHFADKEDAFLVAYDVGLGKCLALVEHAYAAESDWRLAVRAGIAALFEFMATEPSFAEIALVDALTATARTAERSRVGVDAFARMLVPGSQELPGGRDPLTAVTIDAIAGGLFELCLHCALQRRINELPELTPAASYFALAPFIGSEQAARVATGSAQRRGRPRRG